MNKNKKIRNQSFLIRTSKPTQYLRYNVPFIAGKDTGSPSSAMNGTRNTQETYTIYLNKINVE